DLIPKLSRVGIVFQSEVRLIEQLSVHINAPVRQLHAIVGQTDDSLHYQFAALRIANDDQVATLIVTKVGKPTLHNVTVARHQSRRHAVAFDDDRSDDEALNQQKRNR